MRTSASALEIHCRLSEAMPNLRRRSELLPVSRSTVRNQDSVACLLWPELFRGDSYCYDHDDVISKGEWHQQDCRYPAILENNVYQNRQVHQRNSCYNKPEPRAAVKFPFLSYSHCACAYCQTSRPCQIGSSNRKEQRHDGSDAYYYFQGKVVVLPLFEAVLVICHSLARRWNCKSVLLHIIDPT